MDQDRRPSNAETGKVRDYTLMGAQEKAAEIT